MNEYEMNNQTLAKEEEKDAPIQLGKDDIGKLTQKFSGLGKDRKPKASFSYCAYDFNSPEDEPDKSTMYFTEPARMELSVDRTSGFYTLDLIFNNCQNPTLKMLWARLQKHKSNEVFQSDKTWIFYIKLMEEEANAEGALYTADILNPLAFYLIRTVPNEDVVDYEVEPGVFSGGNTVRMLLHPDLVTFQYEDISDWEEIGEGEED